jgi:hypothetical protein
LTLAPQSWSPLIEDERVQPVVTLFIGFMDVEDPEFEPAVIILREPIQIHQPIQRKPSRSNQPQQSVPRGSGFKSNDAAATNSNSPAPEIVLKGI